MKDFNALVVTHYDFVNKQGREVKTTKLIVSLGEFGTQVVNTPLANDIDVLSVIKVRLGYKDNKFIVDSIAK